MIRYWSPSHNQVRFSKEPSQWNGVTNPDGVPELLLEPTPDVLRELVERSVKHMRKTHGAE